MQTFTSSDFEIIICTEAGPLENMAKLLVYTIRNFTGTFKDVAIFSYQPRANKKISRETLKFFERHEVQYVDEVLNTDYEAYPLANKPLACAHREQHSSADYLLFLDSDTFFLQEPSIFGELEDYDLGLQPTDFPNIATDVEFKSGEATYWKKLYELLEVKRRVAVKTTFSKEWILEYYNSGCILAAREQEVFAQWLANFEKVMELGLQPRQGLFFVEQSVFSATVAQMNLKVMPLGSHYNFPIGGYSRKWRGFYPFSLKKIHHVHYHKIFKSSGVNPIERKLNRLNRGQEINRKIEEFLFV